MTNPSDPSASDQNPPAALAPSSSQKGGLPEDASNAEATAALGKAGVQLMVELGPIVGFMVAYNLLSKAKPDNPILQFFGVGPDLAIVPATAMFMVFTLASIVYSWFKLKKLPPPLIVMGVLVAVFGGLTIALRDAEFIKIKVTVVNLFYGVALLGALAFGQNLWKMLFKHAFTLPDPIWNGLALRWGLFYLGMAGFNEVVRHFMSESFWINIRPWIAYTLVLGFLLVNLPYINKWMGKETMDDAAPGEPTPASPESGKA